MQLRSPVNGRSQELWNCK